MKPLLLIIALIFFHLGAMSGKDAVISHQADLNDRLHKKVVRYERLLDHMSQGQFRPDRVVRADMKETWYGTDIWIYNFDADPMMVSH